MLRIFKDDRRLHTYKSLHSFTCVNISKLSMPHLAIISRKLILLQVMICYDVFVTVENDASYTVVQNQLIIVWFKSLQTKKASLNRLQPSSICLVAWILDLRTVH